MGAEAFKAEEELLSLRREGLTSAAHQFLSSQPLALAVVYFGSILFREYEGEGNFDTDFILLAEPKFIHTPYEVDNLMNPYLSASSQRHRVLLPHADTFEVVKIPVGRKSVELGPFSRDYGNLIVGRYRSSFERPSGRTVFSVSGF